MYFYFKTGHSTTLPTRGCASMDSTKMFASGIRTVVIDKLFISAIHSRNCLILIGGGEGASVTLIIL